MTLLTDPPGADVLLERFEEVDRALVGVPAGILGVSPLVGVALEPGSWRLRIPHPACDEVVYPLALRRGEHLPEPAPGEAHRRAIVLPPKGSFGADECYVPAGWFQAGGDPEAPDALPSAAWWIEGFAIGRLPVTNREFGAFLDACAGPVDGHPFVRSPSGWVPARRLDGVIPGPELPVVDVSWGAATAYSDWRARATGLPCRFRATSSGKRQRAASIAVGTRGAIASTRRSRACRRRSTARPTSLQWEATRSTAARTSATSDGDLVPPRAELADRYGSPAPDVVGRAL